MESLLRKYEIFGNDNSPVARRSIKLSSQSVVLNSIAVSSSEGPKFGPMHKQSRVLTVDNINASDEDDMNEQA